MEYLIVCLIPIALAVIGLVQTDKVDMALNYSMKKKVNTDKIPLWFPSNRATESAFGPSLEQPNKGTYLPAFVCCCITYALPIVYLAVAIPLHFCLNNRIVDKWVTIVSYVVMCADVGTINTLWDHYSKKYSDNHPYWIGLINEEIARRNDTSENND